MWQRKKKTVLLQTYQSHLYLIYNMELFSLHYNSRATFPLPIVKAACLQQPGGNMELYPVRKSPPTLAVDKEVAFLWNIGFILHLVGTRRIVSKHWKNWGKEKRMWKCQYFCSIMLSFSVGVSDQIMSDFSLNISAWHQQIQTNNPA